MATSPSPRARTAGALDASAAQHDVPSSKYKELADPPKTLLEQAASQPQPILPKLRPLRSWQATRREEVPLSSGLIGGAALGCAGLQWMASHLSQR